MHQKHSNSDSLAGNLGDGYLLAHNPVYARIRKAALQGKIKFSSTRFHDYDVLPLSQLPKLLSLKTVPYVDNVNALIEIEKVAPGVFQINEAPPLRANYILHESAHGVARALRIQYLGQNPLPERELALTILFEESFSNAAESLLSVFSTTQIHEEFLNKNAYIIESASSRVLLRSSVKLIGLASTFRLVLLSFLYSNFLRTTISSHEFDRVLTVVLMNDPKTRLKLSKKEVLLLKMTFLGGFDLDPVFTIRTNSFCLRLLGIKTKLPKLFAFDFLEYFEGNQGYQNCLNAMTGLIVDSNTK